MLEEVKTDMERKMKMWIPNTTVHQFKFWWNNYCSHLLGFKLPLDITELFEIDPICNSLNILSPIESVVTMSADLQDCSTFILDNATHEFDTIEQYLTNNYKDHKTYINLNYLSHEIALNSITLQQAALKASQLAHDALKSQYYHAIYACTQNFQITLQSPYLPTHTLTLFFVMGKLTHHHVILTPAGKLKLDAATLLLRRKTNRLITNKHFCLGYTKSIRYLQRHGHQ